MDRGRESAPSPPPDLSFLNLLDRKRNQTSSDSGTFYRRSYWPQSGNNRLRESLISTVSLRRAHAQYSQYVEALHPIQGETPQRTTEREMIISAYQARSGGFNSNLRARQMAVAVRTAVEREAQHLRERIAEGRGDEGQLSGEEEGTSSKGDTISVDWSGSSYEADDSDDDEEQGSPTKRLKMTENDGEGEAAKDENEKSKGSEGGEIATGEQADNTN